ncbi:MAG: hypothetical protein A2Y21_05780 [Clostridiales bacterium GWC2_40_7]|nr:MAG: hypothetical protein A2Y21_05780 [Clostridiales bacterium GWC2_40_7]
MASKTATWGEIIKRRQQNKLENNETDMGKSEKTNEKDLSFDESDSAADNSYETNECGDSAFSTPDFLDIGAGHTIVCQVIPSQSATAY